MKHSTALVNDGIAFVDIETTGGPTQRDSITEIGIVEVDEDGVREWSTLVRPEMRIPEHIQRLTGISNDMVADAPRFAQIADELFDRLEGRLFVAHNARFDHGHLRAAFRRIGMDIRPRVLCTVKLSRRLFPEQRRHGLDHLIARHGLLVSERHRALGDAALLWQFWQRLHERFPSGVIAATVRELTGRPALPPHLDPAEIDRLPDGPGVYLFYGEGELPLYIGKSRHVRTRVLSHFSADHTSDRELSLSQQVRRIDAMPTAGELGALILEAELIKSRQPTHNRALRRNRDLCAWRLHPDLLGDWRLELVSGDDLDPGSQDRLYGIFRSRREATSRLRAIARDHALCPPLLGLEKRETPGRCFNFQLKRCKGACDGHEARLAHDLRLMEALAALKVESWPYAGPVGLREGDVIHVIDGWRYLGCARDEAELAECLSAGRPAFDLDLYKLLVKGVRGADVLPLSRPAAQETPRVPLCD
ncbi:exonuclease domain-containing protein [Rhodocyclaceae bacterium SMB388]